ncbi:unnamed protein product [Cuscuta europaea]|uniref:Translocon at the inner envelope membrane of chloroplasts 214 n=1 Tax=Cuscuta europaea TaxID=41803 RepID=A0A9P0ZZH9_CUSEU|nr:unnamed protein product [Cuscuta europaea]
MNRLHSRNSLLDWMGLNEEILDRPLTAEELLVFPEFVWFVNLYKLKPWIIPSESLISNLNLNEMTSQKTGKTQKDKKDKTESKKKDKAEGQTKSEPEGQTKGETQGETKGKPEGETKGKPEGETKGKPEGETKGETEGETEGEKKSQTEIELELFMKNYLFFQFREDFTLNQGLFQDLQIYCLLLRMINRKKMMLSWILREKLNLGLMPQMDQKESVPDSKEMFQIQKRVFQIQKRVFQNFKKDGIFGRPPSAVYQTNGEFLMYETIVISLVHRVNKFLIKKT